MASKVPSFYERFNIKIDSSNVWQNFFNRTLNLFEHNFMEYNLGRATLEASEVHDFVALKLGVRLQPFTILTTLVQDSNTLLRFIEAFYEALGKYRLLEDRDKLNEEVGLALSMNEIDLGLQWKDGIFIPSGAKNLDSALVNDNLKWLKSSSYTNVLRPFRKGLTHFLQSNKEPERLEDTVTDLYEALEAMAKITTGKDRDLSGNREAFISKLKLSTYYSKMLKEYIDYACEYRHGVEQNKRRETPNREEVEAFMYTTGLFLRLAVQKLAV